MKHRSRTSLAFGVCMLLMFAALPFVHPAQAAAQPRRLPPNAVWIHGSGRITAFAPGSPTVVLPQGSSAYVPSATQNGNLIPFQIHQGAGQRQAGLWGLDPRTGRQRLLLATPDAIAGWAASPNSTRLAVTTMSGSDRWRLRILDLASGRARILQQGSGKAVLVPVAWTPAGLFVDQRLWASEAPAQNVWLVDPASGRMRRLHRREHWRAVPSADGTRVALTSGTLGPAGPDNTPESVLSILDTRSGQETALVPGIKAFIAVGEWSPDGSQLAYWTIGSNDQITLHVVNADGSGDRTLQFGRGGVGGYLRDVAWRDRSTLLLLVAPNMRAERTLRLYAVPANGLDARGMQEVGSVVGGIDAAGEIIYVPPTRP